MKRLYHILAKKSMVWTIIISQSLSLVTPSLALVPNDEMYIYQKDFWEQVNAPAAWEYTTGSTNIIVAVIDTGVDSSHEDLRRNLWVNKMEIPDNKKDDDRNGYIDDVNGWNFVENNNVVRPSVFDSDDDKEAVRHGTVAAGLVAAKGNNLTHGTGINWNVSLMPLRAIRSNGNGSYKVIVKAIEYAVNNGADVISMSFIGDEKNSELYSALRKAYEKGIVIVTAGGNFDKDKEEGSLDKKPLYPACLDREDGLNENWILTVGSADKNGKLSIFSSYGKCLDISAPGEYIYSTERYAPEFGFPNEFGGPWFGTSFSAPIIAGAAALLKSIHPEWGAGEIIKVLMSTADPMVIDPATLISSPPRLNIGRAASVAKATPIKNISGGIYFSKEGQLWRYNLKKGKSEMVLNVPDYQVLTFGFLQNYNQEHIYISLKRGTKVYIRVVSESGKLVKEELVGLNSAVLAASKFRMIDGRMNLIFSEYNQKTKNTLFTFYDLVTKKIKTKSVPGKFVSWDVGAAGDIYLGRVNNGSAWFETSPWGDKRKLNIKIPEVNYIYGFFVNAASDLKVLAKKGDKLIFLSVDLLNQKYEMRETGKTANGTAALKTVLMADKKYFLPFSDTSGSFTLYDSDLFPALTIKIPAIKALSQ